MALQKQSKGNPALKQRISRTGSSVRSSGNLWSFAGLGDTALFPDPFSTGWDRGYVPERTMAAMQRHHKIYQTGNNLINAILGDGGRTIPNINPYGPDKAEFKQSDEIARFCDAALRMMNFNPLTGDQFVVSRQMLQCIYPGHKIAPIVLRDQEDGKYKGMRVLDSLVVWDNSGYRLWNDEFGNFTWVEVYGTGNPKLYKREKFFHLAWRPVNGNPLGTSILSPVYEAFYNDIQLDYEEMAYVAQFGRPSINVFASKPPEDGGVEDKEKFPLEWRDGSPYMIENPLYDPNEPEDDDENPYYIQKIGTEVQQNAILFTDFVAGCVNSFEYGSLVNAFEARQGGAEMFRLKREQNARNIVGAMFGTHQVTESEKSMGQGNAEVGEGIAGLNVTEGKVMLERAEENQLLAALVEENYGKAGLDYLPIRDYGSASAGRMPKQLNSIVGIVNSGGFSKYQWWEYCRDNSLPMPYPDSDPVIVRVSGTSPQNPGGGDKTGGQKQGNNGNSGPQSNPSGGTGGAQK